MRVGVERFFGTFVRGKAFAGFARRPFNRCPFLLVGVELGFASEQIVAFGGFLRGFRRLVQGCLRYVQDAHGFASGGFGGILELLANSPGTLETRRGEIPGIGERLHALLIADRCRLEGPLEGRAEFRF